ncbi:hypothetical protein ACROYT_G010463 [Oculina patagonica]
MATPRKGRPRIPGKVKKIRVRESVFKKWRLIKQSSGFINSTDNEFAEVLLQSAVNNKTVREQEASSTFSYGATSSSAAAHPGKNSTLNDAENQNQIVINIDIMETDGKEASVSEGSTAITTGNPIPKVIVTSFSKAADSRSLASEASLVNSYGETTDEEPESATSSDAEDVDVEICDVANPKALKWFESSSINSESSGSSSEIEVVEGEAGSRQKRKKEASVYDSLAERTDEGCDLFVDPLGEETSFGVVLTNYQQKLNQVEDSIEKIKQEKAEGETALNLKEAKKELLKKELALLRKEISAKIRHLETLQKKEDLLYKEKSNLKNKLVHCETLKDEYESKKAHLK